MSVTVMHSLRYGAKIRLPHAAVTTLLFKKNLSFTDRLRVVLKLTIEHARNLGTFAAFYKVDSATAHG
jgi:hypothetical protein